MALLDAALAHISLDVLQLFDRVASLGGIAPAARELELAPSVASRKLAALEKALGTRLFQRTTRRLKLTEAGSLALHSTRQALAALSSAADELAALSDRPAGHIRIAVNHYAAQMRLPQLLGAFTQQYPDITFSIRTSDSLVDMIAGGFDVAIHSGRIPDSSLIGLRVVEFQRVLCAAPSYLARHGEPAAIEDLVRHRCLVHASNEPTTWFFQRGGAVVAQPVRAGIDADSHLLILELARQGLGIARLALDVIQPDLQRGTLVQLLPQAQCVYSNASLPALWIAYPNRQLLVRVRLLVEHLARSLGLHTPQQARDLAPTSHRAA